MSHLVGYNLNRFYQRGSGILILLIGDQQTQCLSEVAGEWEVISGPGE